MSYGRKSLYLDVDKLPKAAKRFTLGRTLNNGMSAKVYQGVDRENGKISSSIIHLLFFLFIHLFPNWLLLPFNGFQYCWLKLIGSIILCRRDWFQNEIVHEI